MYYIPYQKFDSILHLCILHSFSHSFAIDSIHIYVLYIHKQQCFAFDDMHLYSDPKLST